AFVRLYRAGQSAPEELLDNAPPPRKTTQRNDFAGGGVWFSLSVGRKQSAEPRWLLPMLCRAGHLTKRDIGAIRIDETESYVELAPECVDRFVSVIGPGRTLEKTITVTRLDGAPQIAKRAANERPSGDGAPKAKRNHKRKFAKAKAGAANKARSGAPKRKNKKPKRPK
ncbi:MAG: DbpA RNA binding domain-containing protein, partial [Aestuariivirgaceae bacterium]